MASITKEPNGRRKIQFLNASRKRKSIRLGKVPQRTAEVVKLRVECLLAAELSGHTVDDETARWLATVDDRLRRKLARVGLVVPDQGNKRGTKLQEFLTAYMATRTDVKTMTVHNLKQAAGYLVEYFKPDKLLRDITPGDADEWRRWMLAKLGENTVRRHCGRSKQFFRAAVRKRLIAENPFGDMKECKVLANESRFYFVTQAETQAVLDACPDDEWRLLVVLARYGGLRTPSESLLLRLNDVDWEHDKITVTSPKTEHHAGGGSRVIPLFPEIRPFLEAIDFAAPPGTEFFINRYRDSNSNLRTQLQRIIKKAGIEPWGKPFQNMRSTRETELAETFPIHVVCKWIGNTEAVAKKHYLQTTEEHFEKAAQKAAQQPSVNVGTVGQIKREESATPSLIPSVADSFPALHDCTVPPRGFEQLAQNAGNTEVENKSGAEYGARIEDTRLARVVQRWASLPETVRQEIARLVN